MKTKQQFDVVVVEICLHVYSFAFGRHFNAPVVGLSTFGASKWATDLVAKLCIISTTHLQPFHGSNELLATHVQLFDLLVWRHCYTLLLHTATAESAREIVSKNNRLAIAWRNLTKCFAGADNSHVTFGTPQPYTPNIIEVGRMQMQNEIEPLAPKIQTFLDEAKNGAIFISLGSNVLKTKLPKVQLEAITNAFALYPNHRILIKWRTRRDSIT